MCTLSPEALLVAIRSTIRDQIRMEKALETTPPLSELAEDLSEDILQIVKVLGELNDVYDDLRKKHSNSPDFEEIVKSSLYVD